MRPETGYTDRLPVEDQRFPRGDSVGDSLGIRDETNIPRYEPDMLRGELSVGWGVTYFCREKHRLSNLYSRSYLPGFGRSKAGHNR